MTNPRRDDDYRLSFKEDRELYDAIISHTLEGTDDSQVVIGPLVRPPLGKGNDNYFTIATSEAGCGFRVDQITTGDDWGEGIEMRAKTVAAFCGAGKGILVHDTGDELYMARLCETLWPGERITGLRKGIEEERKTRSATNSK
jgi:hypothetical protein